MYHVTATNLFKKRVKHCQKRGYDINLLREAIRLLSENGQLPASYRPHKLSGNYANYWEAHIKGDWLLVWIQKDYELTLILTSTGTHSDIFG